MTSVSFLAQFPHDMLAVVNVSASNDQSGPRELPSFSMARAWIASIACALIHIGCTTWLRGEKRVTKREEITVKSLI